VGHCEDPAIVERIRACLTGDPRAWDELVRSTYAEVYRHMLWLARDPEDARDLTQSAYLRLLEHGRDGRVRLSLYDPERLPFAKFLRVVAYRTFLTHRASGPQKLARRTVDLDELRELLPAAYEPEKSLVEREAWDALDSLPPKQKTAWLLAACGWSYEEIGARLGIGSGGVGALLHRARQSLARLAG